MAHIADLMVDVPGSAGLNNYIARELSPSPVQNVTGDSATTENKKDHIWRMHQPSDSASTRKYQLFPSKEKSSTTSGGKILDAGLLPTMVAGQIGSMDKAQTLLGNGIRSKPKEQAVIRRRKVSVPELGPMTTVQEVAMDSPTIPGRPPLHERSISAPGNGWRQNVFGENMLTCIPGPALDGHAELAIPTAGPETAQLVSDIGSYLTLRLPKEISIEQSLLHSGSSRPQPLSPKALAPLVIPSSSQPSQRLHRSPSKPRLRAGSDGAPEVPPKSARMLEASPLSRGSPFTPVSANSNINSASTAPTSVSSTPSGEGRSSPKPWNNTPAGRSSPKPWTTVPGGRSSPKPMASNGRCSPKPLPTIQSSSPTRSPMPTGPHSRHQSEAPLGSSPHTLNHQRSFPSTTSNPGHRRHESEGEATTYTSIMDRGRPKKRADGSPIKRSLRRSPSNPNRPPALNLIGTVSPARTVVPVTKSEEQKAFEHLPAGHPSATVHTLLPACELATLKRQAIGQASRFEVLAAKDVDSLSRELRALDERCEYLRKTHRSLRAGRRSLHERMCGYLRSPSVASFSGAAMLKQEEALSELDKSIDDWVNKLDQAENRRTRVRQKLLEHVAAALVMETPTATNGYNADKQHISSQAIRGGENTPPRSPVKPHSPERLPKVVEEVPLPPTITPPEQIPARGGRDIESMMSAQSIRIYADSDVYALMDCVEEEINRLGEEDAAAVAEAEAQAKRVREEEAAQKLRSLKKREDTISAGITLNAVAFEGMAAVKDRAVATTTTTTGFGVGSEVISQPRKRTI